MNIRQSERNSTETSWGGGGQSSEDAILEKYNYATFSTVEEMEKEEWERGEVDGAVQKESPPKINKDSNNLLTLFLMKEGLPAKRPP